VPRFGFTGLGVELILFYKVVRKRVLKTKTKSSFGGPMRTFGGEKGEKQIGSKAPKTRIPKTRADPGVAVNPESRV